MGYQRRVHGEFRSNSTQHLITMSKIIAVLACLAVVLAVVSAESKPRYHKLEKLGCSLDQVILCAGEIEAAWNNCWDYQHNLLSVFEDLLNHEAFVDVTIACDGLNLKAHKMVLSACSPYFQSMFYNTPDKHPVVFLKDVRYDEMKALLEFMYRGEVSVDQENLSPLLKVAEGLKIKGLADVNESHAGISTPRLSLPISSAAPPHLPHLPPYSGSLLSPQQQQQQQQQQQ